MARMKLYGKFLLKLLVYKATTIAIMFNGVMVIVFISEHDIGWGGDVIGVFISIATIYWGIKFSRRTRLLESDKVLGERKADQHEEKSA